MVCGVSYESVFGKVSEVSEAGCGYGGEGARGRVAYELLLLYGELRPLSRVMLVLLGLIC